jgi:hypothetical protein
MTLSPLEGVFCRGNYPLTVGTKNLRLVDDRIVGDVHYYVTNPPKDIDMRIPDQLLNCVGFISHDVPTIKYLGTGFVVATKGESGNAFLHFITAKHVAEVVEHGPFVIGMNRKNGGRAMLKYEDAKWFYHPTEPDAVDVAVTVFGLSEQTDVNVHYIPVTAFMMDESIAEYAIGVGDEVNAIGLFTRFSGATRHSPIVRSGNIAMMPTDRIPVKGFDPMEAYLIEGRSIGGLSGSPVFARHTVGTIGNTGKKERIIAYSLGHALLMGLMHGHWDLPVNFKSTEQAEAVNMGISIVVPAKKILEVLRHPELVEMRKNIDKQIKEEQLPTRDIDLPERQVFTQEIFETALKKASRKITPKT